VKVFHAPASTTIRINQAVPSLGESLQPEPITIDDICKNVAIIDVTMAIENRCVPSRQQGIRSTPHCWSNKISRGVMCTSMPSMSGSSVARTKTRRE